MSALTLLWSLSVALAGVAIMWLAGLLIARMLRSRRAARRARDQAEVSNACLSVLAGDADGAYRLSRFARRAGLMSEIVLDLAALVRGAERDRLIETLVVLRVDQRLRARLTRGGLRGRIAAAEALAAFPSPDTLTAVGKAYRSARHATLRVACLSTLIQLGAAPSPAQLLGDIERRRAPDSLLYRAVLARLVPKATEEMTVLLADPTLRPATRAMVAEALGAGGDHSALTALIRAADVADPELREAVVRAIGALGHPQGSETVRAAFADPCWEVRAEACVAAGRLGARPFTFHLNIALSDAVWWVRFRAAEALKTAGPLGLATLEIASVNGTAPVRRSALLALAEQTAA